MEFLTELQMVRQATPQVVGALRLVASRCRIAHELTVGHSIADIVILRANSSQYWPERPLTVVESAILSSLRQLGSATVEVIAEDVFMQAAMVRRLLLGRLSAWQLVRSRGDLFEAPKAWVSRSEVIAVEAKLKKWRDAIGQAVTYKRYADRSYVLLPTESACLAAQHKAAFIDAGVGLLSYGGGKVSRIFPSPKSKQHAWHREFAISRIR